MATTRKQKFEKYQCYTREYGHPGCGHKWNLPMRWQEPVVGIYKRGHWTHDASLRVQESCDLVLDEAGRRVVGYSQGNGKYQGRWAVQCPNCLRLDTSKVVGGVNGRMGKTACETVCAEAAGSACNCQCGGMNHGIL